MCLGLKVLFKHLLNVAHINLLMSNQSTKIQKVTWIIIIIIMTFELGGLARAWEGREREGMGEGGKGGGWSYMGMGGKWMSVESSGGCRWMQVEC